MLKNQKPSPLGGCTSNAILIVIIIVALAAMACAQVPFYKPEELGCYEFRDPGQAGNAPAVAPKPMVATTPTTADIAKWKAAFDREEARKARKQGKRAK